MYGQTWHDCQMMLVLQQFLSTDSLLFHHMLVVGFSVN